MTQIWPTIDNKFWANWIHPEDKGNESAMHANGNISSYNNLYMDKILKTQPWKW